VAGETAKGLHLPVSRTLGAERDIVRKGIVMTQKAHTPAGPEFGIHRHRPRRVAQKLEGYMSFAMAAAAVVLLGILAYGVLSTGSGTPTWMH
jgi:hypothetical protein